MAKPIATTDKLRIGISGWTYAPWRGVFYPKKLPHNIELAYASTQLSSIEINGTFYSLQRPSSFAKWYEQTPADFVFSVKAPRYITHMLRLRNTEAPIANFFLSGVLRLNEKLGPILWQFPPNLQFNPDLFEPFLAKLPRSTKAAARLLKQTDSRMKDRTWSVVDQDRPMFHAMEIRHESFATEAFVKLLRKHSVAMVIADTAGQWPMLLDVTADFVYVRLHGAEKLYASGYSDDALDAWVTRIRAWATGQDSPTSQRLGPAARKRMRRDVYVYFDNDVKVHAPFDAAKLAFKLGERDRLLDETPRVESQEIPRLAWPAIGSKSREK